MKAIFILLTILSAFSLHAQQNHTTQNLVTVNGEGIVKVVPDEVVIRSRIEHEGLNAQTVKKNNDDVVNDVIKYLRSKGIPEKNIHTDYVNLNKNYDYNKKSHSYVANQAITIKIDNLEDYEEIMGGLLNAGLNRIDGIQFGSSEIEKHKTEARKRAVLDARKKAEEYVSPLNQRLGQALTINELETNYFPPMYRMNETMQASSDGAVEESIAPGEMEVSAKVTVGFQLL